MILVLLLQLLPMMESAMKVEFLDNPTVVQAATTPPSVSASDVLPLKWNNKPGDNIIASEATNGYGLVTVSSGEQVVQLYQSNSLENHGKNRSTYLRKVSGFVYKKGTTNDSPSCDDTGIISISTVSGAALTFTSDNPSVATVDPSQNGRIRAENAGHATITASLELEGTKYEENFSVVVAPEAYEASTDLKPPQPVSKAAITLQNNFLGLHFNVTSVSSSLDWKIVKSGVTPEEDVTASAISGIEKTDPDRVVVKNMPAGIYDIMAYPRAKGGTPSYITPALRAYVLTLTVPLRLPTNYLALSMYGNSGDKGKDTYDLYDLENANFPEGLYKVSIQDANIVKIDKGVITPLKEGKTIVSGTLDVAEFEKLYKVSPTSDDLSFAIDVSVHKGLQLNKTSVKMRPGTEEQLELISPMPGKAIQWKSKDPTVATIDEFGKIHALTAGTTTVEVSVKVNGVLRTAICLVEVVDEVQSIQLETNQSVLKVSESTEIRALVRPVGAQHDLVWRSSDPSVLDFTDTFYNRCIAVAKKAGRVTVTAVDKDSIIVGSITITVTQDITSLKLSDTAVSLPFTSKSYQLYAIMTPPQEIGDLIEWKSSDETIATVDRYGKVTFLKNGVVVITAVAPNGLMASCTITIGAPEATLTLDVKDKEMIVGETFRLYHTYKSQDSTAQPKIKWSSSNTKIATVDANGVVTAKGVGNAVITVATDEKTPLTATCNVSVGQRASSLQLDVTNKEMTVGEKFRFTYNLQPTGSTVLRWSSSNTAVATVDASGVVTAKAIGYTVITVLTTDGTTLMATCNITVKQKASALKLDVTKLTLNVEQYYYLKASLTPGDSSDTITFESTDSKVAIVDSSGKITAKSVGTTNIFVKTSSGLSAFCTVTVTQEPQGIQLDKTKAKINIGDTLELIATFNPKETKDTIKWTTSDNKIATVSEKGIVKGVGAGQVVISAVTAKGGYMAYCIVTVVDPDEGKEDEETKNTIVTLDVNSLTLGIGKTYQLLASVNGVQSNGKVTFKSNKPAIAKVNKNGVITALKEGRARITCRAKDGSGALTTCEVEVVRYTTSLEIEPTSISLMQGKTKQLAATRKPKSATNKKLLWTSSNPDIAFVDGKGKVTAIKPGTTMITVETQDGSELSSVCYVNVIGPTLASAVTFSTSEVVMVPGETKEVPYSITPNNITEKFTFSSDNSAVAQVDSSGKITARSLGTANIILMTESGKKGSVQVYVVGLSRTSIVLEQYTESLIDLQVEGNLNNKLSVRWDTDNQSVAEVINGKITAKGLGTTRVYAIVNGRWLPCTVRVVKIGSL